MKGLDIDLNARLDPKRVAQIEAEIDTKYYAMTFAQQLGFLQTSHYMEQ